MKTALVTGGGRGIGFAFCQQLVARGDRVIATVRSLKRSRELEALARSAPELLTIVLLDVSDPTSIAAMKREVSAQVDHLDILINNAGISSKGVPKGQRNGRFGALEPLGIERMIRVNAIGPLLITQALAPLLEAGEHAKVISLSSSRGSIGAKQRGGSYGYSTSKATLNMLMRSVAFDLAPSGIISVVIDPGWVSTEMGGPKADLTPAASVAGMLTVIDGLTRSDTGRFLRWDGGELPW